MTDLVEGPRSQVLIMVAYCSMLIVPAAFLAGLLRSRLARGGLAQLFRDLSGMRGAALETALGRALGDPTLVLAYGVPLPQPAPGRAVAPITRDGRTVAALLYDASLDDDPELVEAVRAAATIALENEHLVGESEARLAEVQASRQRIVAAGDAERRRLERNLHDGAQQRLVALSMELRLLRSDSGAIPPRRNTRRVGERGARPAPCRSCASWRAGSIRPCSSMAWRPRSTRSRRVRRCPGAGVRRAGDLPEPVELAVYLVAAKPSRTPAGTRRPRGSVRPTRTSGGVAIEVADDGVGGADPARGSGLRGLADRVEALDGRLRVTSPRAPAR